MQEKTLAQNWTATSDIELHISLHLQQQTPHSASCILNFKWTQPSINIFQEPATASFFCHFHPAASEAWPETCGFSQCTISTFVCSRSWLQQLYATSSDSSLKWQHPAWTLILAVFSSNLQSLPAAAAWRLKHPLPEDSNSLSQHHKLFQIPVLHLQPPGVTTSFSAIWSLRKCLQHLYIVQFHL